MAKKIAVKKKKKKRKVSKKPISEDEKKTSKVKSYCTCYFDFEMYD
jgi:hypothetical protein